MPGPNRNKQNREEREEIIARIRNLLDEASCLCHTVNHLIPEIPENSGACDAATDMASKIDSVQATVSKLAF